MIMRTVNNFKAFTAFFFFLISHLSSPYNKSTLCLSQQKAYAIFILRECIFGKADKMLSFHPDPGLAHKRQSIACQMNSNWLTVLSFMASLHLHMKTRTLICREQTNDIVHGAGVKGRVPTHQSNMIIQRPVKRNFQQKYTFCMGGWGDYTSQILHKTHIGKIFW